MQDVFRDVQRRREAHETVAVQRPSQQNAVVKARPDNPRRRFGVHQFEAQHRPAPAHRRHERVVFECRPDGRLNHRSGPLGEALVQQNLERGEASGAAHRMAAEGGDVAQRRVVAERGHHRRGSYERAQRHPAAEGLGER